MVSSPVENDYQKSTRLPNYPKVLLGPKGKIHPEIQNSRLGQYQAKSIFKGNVRKGYLTYLKCQKNRFSQSNYELDWIKWVSWCHRKQTDPLSNHLREVLDFLAEMLSLGLEYSTINNHRSAISDFHESIGGFSVENPPKVCNLMTGVYNQRPPKSRYCFVQDIETVLRYLRSIPINKPLSTKMLTLKSTMLLALTSTLRCSEKRHLDIRFYTKSERNFCD